MPRPRVTMLGAVALSCFAASLVAAETPRETVVLLHGFARTHRSMAAMAEGLRAAGFRPVNLDYPSLEPFERLTARLEGELELCCAAGEGPIHFVTHSMGGILLRRFLAERSLRRLGRVVMLSPPNQGTPVVDQLRRYRLLDLALGPAARRLGTGDGDLPQQLGPVDFPLGVITGNRSINPLFSRWIPGEDDGQVGVGAAEVAGLDDFLVVPCSHSFIMTDPRVIEETVHFLRFGVFSGRGPGDRAP